MTQPFPLCAKVCHRSNLAPLLETKRQQTAIEVLWHLRVPPNKGYGEKTER
jgi:hypothetical protein